MKKIYSLLFFGLIVFHTFSQTYTITTGLPNNIISGSGTTISGLGDDNFVGPFNIGFNFTFFNTNQTQFYIAANGSILFGSGDGSVIGTIPSTSTPNNFIAFASTDQYPGASSSPILNYFISGTSPNRILVINYQNIRHYSNNGLITSVQLQLFEGSGKIEIHNIQNNSGGINRTIGIENSTGTVGFTPTGMNYSTSIGLSNQMIRFSTCTLPPAPTISPSTAPTICSSSPSATLTATCSVGSLSWSTGATTSAITVSPTQTTTYTATCLDNSCQTSSSTTVPVLQTPSVSPSGTNYICTGNSITLTASSTTSGVSFQWYKDGSSVQNATNATINVNSAGSYSVIVTKDGCTATSASTVINENSTIPNAPIISPETSFTCPNSNVSLTASGCTGTVFWSNGSTGSTLIANVSSSITYTAICKVDGCNSINSNVATINIAAVSITAPNGLLICPSNTTLLQSTTSPSSGLQYQWLLNSNPIQNANSISYQAGSAGNFALRITLPNNCSVTSFAVPINVTNAVVPTIAICDGTETNAPVTRVWDKLLGGTGSDEMNSMIKTPDNGYIIVGSSTSSVSGDKTSSLKGYSDTWVVKIDALGNKVWDKSFGEFNADTPTKIIQTNDGNYLVAGYQTSYNYDSNYWIFKIDENGNQLWQKAFAGSLNGGGINVLYDVILLNDGYLLSGISNGGTNNQKTENSKGNSDFWIIKVDFNGNKIWDKTIGGSAYEYVNSVIKTTDDGFILAGYSASPISGDKTQPVIGTNGYSDYWIVKIDANGNKVWDRTYGGFDFDDLKRIINSPDGGFLLAGNSSSGQEGSKSQASKGYKDFWIIKVDANGNKLWDNAFGGSQNEVLTDALALSDGYLLSGYTESSLEGDISQSSRGASDYWLLKIGFDGNKVWDKRFGSTAPDRSNVLLKLDDNNFFLGGISTGNDGDKTQITGFSGDYWFLKLKTCEAKTSPITINAGSSVELIASGCPGLMTWNTGQTTGIINVSPTQNTNYLVSCISNNSCTTQANVQVNVNCSSNFTVSAQGNNQNPVVCNTSPSVTLEASGCSGNITWSDGSTSSSITISPTATGTYSATCSGTSCTPVTKTIQVTYITNPVITAAGNTTVCVGTSVNLTASTNVTGGTLQWYLDGNSITGANALIYQATATGAYSFKVLKDGCEAVSNTINITVNTVVPPKPTLTASSLYACGRGYPITLTVSGCNGTVNWYSSNTNLGFWNGTPSGSTAVAGINGSVKFYVSCTENVCTSVVSDTINADFAKVIVTAEDNLICTGGSLLLNATIIPNLGITGYQWQNGSSNISGATSSSYTATTASTYNLVVTFSNGCTLGSYSNVGGTNISLQNSGNLPNPNIVVTNNSTSGPAVKVLDRRFGSSTNDYLKAITKTPDFGYLLGGNNYNASKSGDMSDNSRGNNDYWVVKLDSNFNKKWDKRFGSFESDVLTKVINSSNKGNLIIGYSNGHANNDKTSANKGIYNTQTGSFSTDYWIVKLDSLGNKQWDKTFGGEGYESANNAILNTDKGYLIGGSTDSGINGDASEAPRGANDFWIIKTDSLGNKIWDKRYGSTGSESISSMLQINSGYLLAGSTNSPVGGDKSQALIGSNDVWIIKTDILGNKIWDKTFGTVGDDRLGTITNANDGGYVFVIEDNSVPKYIVYKIDEAGNKIWEKDLLGTPSYSIKSITPNASGYLVLGNVASNANANVSENGRGSLDNWLIQIDNDGNKLWDRRFGGSSLDMAQAALLENKNLIIAGNSQSPVSGERTQNNRGSNSDDYWLLKVNLNQNISQPVAINLGQSINLIANNCPGTVIWSGGTSATGAMVSVSPTIPTTYTATCNAYGCSTSSNIQIGINCSSNFIANAKDGNGAIITNPTVCTESPSVNLEATGCLGTISWSNGATGSTTLVSPTINTTYTATCSDAGCTSVTSSVQVKTFETPIVTASGTTTFCVGSSITLNATVIGSGYSFQWYQDGVSVNNLTNTIVVNQSGSYQVMITKNGCSSISLPTVITVNSTIPVAPNFTSPRVFACTFANITLNANGCNTGQIAWSNGSTGSSIQVYFAGDTTTTYTTTCMINGCISPSSQPVRVVRAESKILNGPLEYLCTGGSIQLIAQTYPNVTYQWQQNGSDISGQTNPSYTVNQLGSFGLKTTFYEGCVVYANTVTIETSSSVITPTISALNNNSNVAPTKVWDRNFGGSNFESTPNIIPTDDKGFILIGYSNSSPSGNKTTYNGVWIVKIDSSGNKIWEKTHAKPQGSASKVAKLSDGGYLITGSFYNSSNFDISVLKVDNNGNAVWSITQNSSPDDEVGGVLEAANGNILIAGTRTASGNSDFYLQRLSATGTPIYSRYYSVSGNETLTGICQTSDGDILLSGTSNSGINGEKQTASKGGIDNWLLKVAFSNSDRIWDKTIGGTGDDYSRNLVPDGTTGFILTGHSNSPISGDKSENQIGGNDFWTVKVDNNGDKIWDKTNGTIVEDTYPVSILSNDNQILIAGRKGTTYGTEDYYLMKLNNVNGNKIWEKIIVGNGSDFVWGLANTSNNGLIVSGTSLSSIGSDKTAPNRGGGEFDWWIVKLKNGESLPAPATINQGQTITLVASNCQGNVTWSNGMSGAEINVIPTTNTTYTATCSAFGCTTTSNIQININPCGQIVSLTQTENITTGTSQAPTTIKAQDSINATNTIGQPPTNASAKYAAGKAINLNPGFKVEIGSIFQAKISATPCNE